MPDFYANVDAGASAAHGSAVEAFKATHSMVVCSRYSALLAASCCGMSECCTGCSLCPAGGPPPKLKVRPQAPRFRRRPAVQAYEPRWSGGAGR